MSHVAVSHVEKIQCHTAVAPYCDSPDIHLHYGAHTESFSLYCPESVAPFVELRLTGCVMTQVLDHDDRSHELLAVTAVDSCYSVINSAPCLNHIHHRKLLNGLELVGSLS